MFKNNFHFALFYAIVVTLAIFACIKSGDSSEENSSTSTSAKANQRNENITATETFKIVAYNGQCYEVTLERLSNNDVVFRKTPISCSEVPDNQKGYYFSELALAPNSSQANIKPWFIPLFGNDTIQMRGGWRVECFCEVPGDDEGCQEADCWMMGGVRFKWCQPDCCDDCDARICLDGLIASDTIVLQAKNGVFVDASSIIFDLDEGVSNVEDRSDQDYYGKYTVMNVETLGNTVVISRETQTTWVAPKLYNLTTLVPDGGILQIPPDGKYWYVSFDLGVNAFRITNADPPRCEPDGECDGSCELEQDPNSRCYECKCTGAGDCDLVFSYASGGIIVEADSIQVLDL